jgi:hypothetical protein
MPAMPAICLLLLGVGSAMAGEYADSLPQPPPEYHFGAATLAAAVTLPALYLAYSLNSHLGLFATASLPPMIGYAIAENPGLAFPLVRNLSVVVLTYSAYMYYIVNIAAGVAGGGPRSEEEEAEDNQTASDILRYGFFAMGPLTLLDFIIVALPHEPQRLSLNLAPDRAVLVYRF